MLWLALFTLTIVTVASLLLTFTPNAGIANAENQSFGEMLWQSLMRVMDGGTMSGDTGWPDRGLSLLVTMAGIFLVGALIGFITNLLDQKLQDLRKGTSLVLEKDHTLILGWSPRVPTIVQELVDANSSRRSAAIVIVADEDKTTMEDALGRAVTRRGNTAVVCRSGEPWSEEALVMGNLATARSVIVTSSSGDASIVKSLLAIRTSPEGNPAVVIAELEDEGLARSLERVIGPTLTTVCSDVMVAELTAQACRQRGVSTVFSDLLNFEGAEIYEAAFPQLTGKTYAEVCFSFATAAVIGISGPGGLRLNPPGDSVLVDSDTVLAVCEDDSDYHPSATVARRPDGADQVVGAPPVARTRRLAVVGWSRLGARVVAEMDEFMAYDTVVDVYIDPALVDRAQVEQTSTHNASMTVIDHHGGPDVLAERIHGAGYDQVIVLGMRDALSLDEADARTLLTVLALHAHPRQSADRLRIVIELLDQNNASLAEATGADDFVVSNQLTSQMMSQLSENPELAGIFDELFRPEGCSIQLRPLVAIGSALTFGDIVCDGLRQGMSPIGVIDVATGNLRLAPDKRAPLLLSPTDQVVIVAAGT